MTMTMTMMTTDLDYTFDSQPLDKPTNQVLYF